MRKTPATSKASEALTLDAGDSGVGGPNAEISDVEILADEAMDVRLVDLPATAAGSRIDKVLAAHAPDLSRARIQALMGEGRVFRGAKALNDPSAKALAGEYRIEIPPPTPAVPQPEAIALHVHYEDAYLIVVEKPAGMAVHPAPGSETGTLVNALLHHCGESLSGIGGVARPGIVHRIDKETSGILVAAKTDAAHQGLSALFATHDIDRVYVAFTRGAPHPAKGSIDAPIARSTSDRKKMAIARTGGRHAITHYAVEQTFGPAQKPLAARVSCRLETGRTHQIRVHLASKGAPCLGDPTYGSGPPAEAVKRAITEAGLHRQALHAAVLGFVHPVTGATLRFESALPSDMARLQDLLTDM